MQPSTTRQIIRIRDAVLSDTLCEYVRGYNTAAATTIINTPLELRIRRATRTYELAVSNFLDESDEDRVLSKVRRADFDGELISRLDASLGDSMRWAFDDEQRDRCRLMKEIVTGSTEQCTLVWIHHLERLNVGDAKIQEMAGMNGDVEDDSIRRRIGSILGRDDDEKEDIDRGEDQEGFGEEVNDETNHNGGIERGHGAEHGVDHAAILDDDCIMFGKYIGDEGVGKRWVCLLCKDHPGTAYKGSFVRHLARKHGVQNVRKSLRHLPHKVAM